MSGLDQALARLDRALDAAEAAVGRALDAADAGRAKEEELTTLADDRLRLAELLDISAAEAEKVEAERETDRREIARRLDAAIETVEGVLAEAGG